VNMPILACMDATQSFIGAATDISCSKNRTIVELTGASTDFESPVDAHHA